MKPFESPRHALAFGPSPVRPLERLSDHLGGLARRPAQERWVEWADPGNDQVGNILPSRVMGADVRLDPAGFDIGADSTVFYAHLGGQPA